MSPEICLSCIIRHPQHNNIKTDMAESEETVKISVQETSKDLISVIWMSLRRYVLKICFKVSEYTEY